MDYSRVYVCTKCGRVVSLKRKHRHDDLRCYPSSFQRFRLAKEALRGK